MISSSSLVAYPYPNPSQQAICVPNQAVPDLPTLLHGAGMSTRIIYCMAKIHKSTNSTPVNSIEHTPAPATKVAVPIETIEEEEIETCIREKMPKDSCSKRTSAQASTLTMRTYTQALWAMKLQHPARAIGHVCRSGPSPSHRGAQRVHRRMNQAVHARA